MSKGIIIFNHFETNPTIYYYSLAIFGFRTVVFTNLPRAFPVGDRELGRYAARHATPACATVPRCDRRVIAAPPPLFSRPVNPVPQIVIAGSDGPGEYSGCGDGDEELCSCRSTAFGAADRMADLTPRNISPPPMRYGGARGRRQVAAVQRSFENDNELHEQLLARTAPVFSTEASRGAAASSSIDTFGRAVLPGGVRRKLVLDEQGETIQWPWEGGAAPTRAPKISRGDPAAAYFAEPSPLDDSFGSHAADATVLAGLCASTADGKMGKGSTGVRAWEKFCAKNGRAAMRPIDPNAPLWVKLDEELWAMRFISHIVDSRNVTASTARSYFGQASGYHRRTQGIGLCGGLDLARLPEMVKGLRRLRDEPERKLRRGVTPQMLRKALDKVFPAEQACAASANIRAALCTALQGLMRGREICKADGKAWRATHDLARGDIAALTADRLVFLMRPAKNMRNNKGKTVPIVIGAGGRFIDAHAEVAEMLRLDPTPAGAADTTPMFRRPDGSAFSVDYVRSLVQLLMASIGEVAADFGAHSLRIGGATALFAAGADPLHIRTMGRWSSDCWRLYVRACFEQTLDWTRRAGSQVVHDVQGTAARAAQEVDEY